MPRGSRSRQALPDLREQASWSPADLGCRDIVTGLAFSPDSRHLIVGGWDGLLRRLVLRPWSQNGRRAEQRDCHQRAVRDGSTAIHSIWADLPTWTRPGGAL